MLMDVLLETDIDPPADADGAYPVCGFLQGHRVATVVEKKDNRYKPARTFPAEETEALTQTEIQRILHKALDEAAPQPLKEILDAEEGWNYGGS